jgi:hypothetical protein
VNRLHLKIFTKNFEIGQIKVALVQTGSVAFGLQLNKFEHAQLRLNNQLNKYYEVVKDFANDLLYRKSTQIDEYEPTNNLRHFDKKAQEHAIYPEVRQPPQRCPTPR